MTHAFTGPRTTMLDGTTLALSGTGGPAWMLGSATTWFTASLTVFRICERFA